MNATAIKMKSHSNDQKQNDMFAFARMCNSQAIQPEEPIYIGYVTDMGYLVNRYGRQIKATHIC